MNFMKTRGVTSFMDELLLKDEILYQNIFKKVEKIKEILPKFPKISQIYQAPPSSNA